jgi:hypothetical protein
MGESANTLLKFVILRGAMKNRNAITAFSRAWIPALLVTALFVIASITALATQSIGLPSDVPGSESVRSEARVSESSQAAVDYLIAHFQSPEDYIASTFKYHDLVFLGEGVHGSKQNLLFLQKLLPRLYKAGVYNIGYEMICSDEQPEVDRLLAAKEYDNTAALTLLFHWDPQIGFAAQEYADVLRAAWTLNQSLPKNAPRFRIVGTDLRPDWSLVKPGENPQTRLARWKAWAGSNQIARNVWMMGMMRHEFLDKGLKALIYTGAGHAPLYVGLDQREETGLRFSVAHLLFRRFGDRVNSLLLLSSASQNPMIGEIMSAMPLKYQVIGFDAKGTPVGDLPLPDRMAASILTDKKPLTLADYTDGFVYISSTFDVVTIPPGFITPARVDEAKREGWLPDIPEITADSIMKQSAEMLKATAPPSAAPK